ncbi:MAG: hypothetical protein V4764_14960 [Burkholderia sp.]
MEQSWRNSSSAKFVGKVGDHSFKLRPNIKHRNSFLPMISGSVVEEMAERRVKISMGIHPFVMLFLVIWFITFAAIAESQIVSHGFVLSELVVMPVTMIIFAIALVAGGFVPEARAAKIAIMTTLHAKQDD